LFIMNAREIVITGFGLNCVLGLDIDRVTSALQAGRTPAFQRWQPAVDVGARCQVLGLVEDPIAIDKQSARFMGKAARLAHGAARRAIAMAEITDLGPLGVVVGSGTGDVESHRETKTRLDETKNAKKLVPTLIPRIMSSTVSANLATVLETRGPSFSVAAACAGGAYNILIAAQLIAAGHMDSAIAGGVEVADIHFHAGFDAMRAYNGQDNDNPGRASRPYAADRAGFIFSEGAGVVVLEARETALARGAKIRGRLLGFGMSSDGTGEMVAPSSGGQISAMRAALAHARLSPEDVDYVNTHGTSTPVGDVAEVRGIREVMAGRHVAYGSTKAYTGHTISAAGAIETIFSLCMMENGFIAPSANADPLDPELVDYPPVLEPRRAELRHVLSNSFGFGGTNVTLALGRT
jgi:3-oxoacyl-[acyl-carrier-protein] synthase I